MDKISNKFLLRIAALCASLLELTGREEFSMGLFFSAQSKQKQESAQRTHTSVKEA